MVDRLCIAGDANQPLLAHAIHRLKYTAVRGLAAPLTEYLVQALAKTDASATFADHPLLVPVPLHPRRHAERGFNQSELLSDQLARRIHMAHRTDVLARIRQTTSQVKTASRWERLENMRDAFRVTRPEHVNGRSIILVDDVCTTGATLDACAHALKDAGASSVTAVVLARG
jgi:ComF family protein